MWNRISCLFLLLTASTYSLAQDCNLTLQGQVVDHISGEPLEYVNVYVSEINRGAVTDSLGGFVIKAICRGEYHLNLSHVGCDTKRHFVRLDSTTNLTLEMDHSEHILEQLLITDDKDKVRKPSTEFLSSQDISDRANKNFSSLLEGMMGVRVIKNGGGIAKPMVQGLTGNRLTILNNGVVQAGQQWGADHSPEIDPLNSNVIKVIKGSSAIEYQSANLGAVIVVEPRKLDAEPHLHGAMSTYYESNGRGIGATAMLQQKSKYFIWRANASAKRSGDKHTPDYFLNNTGTQEVNFSLQVEKSWNPQLKSALYLSSFNTRLGVLRGSHIGNLTDLEDAFSREVPLFTSDTFSYQIESPYQNVAHHLAKFETQYFMTNSKFLQFRTSLQYNNRKEFDVRRGNRSEIPGLSLLQFSWQNEVKYVDDAFLKGVLSAGIQSNIIDNTNDSETGIYPLIPDYRSFETGFFVQWSRKINRSFWEFGARFDHLARSVAAFDSAPPRDILRYNDNFQNLAFLSGYSFEFSKNDILSFDLGFGTRSPGINELYSGGLHQGVSGIEEGDPSLQIEKALKTSIAFKSNSVDRLTFLAQAYYQYFSDYIFLKPQDEFRLTIRGAFPVFAYEQTDAVIYGIDANVRYDILDALQLETAVDFIKGQDISADEGLINLPGVSTMIKVAYEYPKTLKYGAIIIQNPGFSIEDRYTFARTDILPSQDFVAPPDAYNLVNLQVTSNILIHAQQWRLSIAIDNILDTRYRDYLNRQRYFADDTGRNVKIGMKLDF